MPVEVLPELTIVWPKTPPQVCVDIDGCVCEYDFPKIVKDFFGVDLSAQAIFAYDLADVLGVAPALINTMFTEQVYGKPSFVAGAIETLMEWKWRGIGIHIFSNRVKYMGMGGLAGWMLEYGIPFDMIDGGENAYDLHIDDSPAKLMATNSKIKLLFNQPWNKRCLNILDKLERVYDWSEVQAKVSELSRDVINSQ